MSVMTNLQAVHDAMLEALRNDDRVLLMGEDVGPRGGVFRASQGFTEEFGEERIIDTPLAEYSIVSTAIGMTINGLRPIAEIQFADFSFPAFEQIVNEAARMRYRSNSQYFLPMVIRMPYGGGVGGGLYHSQSVEAFYSHVPGLYVMAPATPYDIFGMFRTAVKLNDPVVFLEHKKIYRAVKGEVPDEYYEIPAGKADVKREGDDLSIITFGMMLHESLKAAETLEKEGISVEVLDLRSLAPLDKEAIIETTKKTGKALIVYEDNLTLGIGAEVSATIAQEAFEYLDGPVMRVAAPDVPGVPFSPPMQNWFMPNAEKIANAARDLAEY